MRAMYNGVDDQQNPGAIGMNHLKALDSLCANEFAVEIDGQRVEGIFTIRGFTPLAYTAEGRVMPPFIISKMVQRDPGTVFNAWVKATMEARDSATRPRRDLAIVAVDDGVETRRWLVKNAMITAIAYSDFNAASFEMVEENVTIVYEDIEESWVLAG
jgi:hypothetical protein